MSPQKEDLTTMTQLIDLLQDRGCSVDKATAMEHSKALAEIPHIREALGDIRQTQARTEAKLDAALETMGAKITANDLYIKVAIWLVSGAAGLGLTFWVFFFRAASASVGAGH